MNSFFVSSVFRSILSHQIDGVRKEKEMLIAAQHIPSCSYAHRLGLWWSLGPSPPVAVARVPNMRCARARAPQQDSLQLRPREARQPGRTAGRLREVRSKL